MHDNDLLSKIEYILVKYNVSSYYCNLIHEIASLSTYPIVYNPDVRYVAVSMLSTLMHLKVVDDSKIEEELYVYSYSKSLIDSAKNASVFFDYIDGNSELPENYCLDKYASKAIEGYLFYKIKEITTGTKFIITEDVEEIDFLISRFKKIKNKSIIEQ